MASEEKVDVLILGGGPAGSVLAERLSRLGYDVVLAERQRFPRYAVGESLPPSVELLLKRTGILPSSRRVTFPRTTGYMSAWGTDSVSFTSHDASARTRGFQVGRASFDSMLLQAARKAGAVVFEGHYPVELTHASPGWRVVLRTPAGEKRSIVAKFLCDASGRSRLLARRLQLELKAWGRLIGLLGYWDLPHVRRGTNGYNTLVESVANGWLYTAQLGGKKRVAGFMTDRDLLPLNLRRRAPAIYTQALSWSRHVQRLMEGAAWKGEVKIFAANPTLIERCCGSDWLLVGDAASTLDPLCSQGVQKAIASALAACTVIHTMLAHPERREMASEFYCERERAGLLSHLDALRRYYAREPRWEQMPFWKRRAMNRHAHAESDPAAVKRQAGLAPTDRLFMTPGTTITSRPVIEGEFVELRSVVLPPRTKRGLRYCGSVCVPDVLALLESRSTVAEVLACYRRSHSGVSQSALLSGLAQLVELGLISSVPWR